MSDKEINKGLDHDEPLLFDIGDVRNKKTKDEFNDIIVENLYV